MTQWGTGLCLCNGYHIHSSPIILGKSFCVVITHSSSVFPYKINSCNLITTFSVSNLNTIAAATEMKVLPRSISSASSTPGISESQTHLLTMHDMTQTWHARTLVPGRPWNEYFLPGIRSSVDWWIGWTFSSLTASSRHSWSNSVLIELKTVFRTELVFSGLRTTSSFSTCSWTFLAHLTVCFWSSMISFSFSNVSWADGLIFWLFWNSLQCYAFYQQATIWMNIYGWNEINSIVSYRTYINRSLILLPTILLSLLASTVREFQSLCLMISSWAHLSLTQQLGIALYSPIICYAITFIVAFSIWNKNIFGLCW